MRISRIMRKLEREINSEWDEAAQIAVYEVITLQVTYERQYEENRGGIEHGNVTQRKIRSCFTISKEICREIGDENDFNVCST